MTWVAWRVERNAYLAALVGFGLFGLWLAMSGIQALSGWAMNSAHGTAVVLYVAPGILGLALGAPLVGSEAERGTDRLALTQSVSRVAWLMRKVLIGAIACALLIGGLCLLTDWWTRAGYGQGVSMDPKVFSITGTVAIGYGLFSFALGVALGAVVRRASWAFAVGVPVVVVLRLIVDALRNALVSPVTAVDHSLIANWPTNAYVLNSAYLPIGRLQPSAGMTWLDEWTSSALGSSFRTCTSGVYGQGAALAQKWAHCAAAAHLQRVVQFQPDSHYWPLQLAETGIFVGTGLVLIGFATAWVRADNG